MKPLLTNQHLIKVMPCLFESMLEYNSSTNMVYIHYYKHDPSLEQKWHDYDFMLRYYLKKYVYTADQNLMKTFFSKEEIKKFLASGKESTSLYIRYIKDEIEIQWYEIFINRIDDYNVIFSGRNIQSELQHKVISRAIEGQYDYVVHIDIKNNSYVLYTSLPSAETYLPPAIGENYHEALYKYNYEVVVSSEVVALTENMKIPNVIKELEKNDEYVLYTLMNENNQQKYKRLCFRYLDKKKEKLLLSRIDISELITKELIHKTLLENKTKYQNKLIKYLDNMPIAYCTIKVLVDENNNPYDFTFVYTNKALCELEGVKYGELVNKSFYQFFENADKKWLKYYYDTAFNGVSHTIKDYSPEIGKHLLIYTHQPEKGICGCILQDITSKRKLEIELEQSNERMKLLLKSTTDGVFYYDLESKMLFPFGENTPPLSLSDNNFPDKIHKKNFEQAFSKFEKEIDEISFDVKMRFNISEPFKWFNVTFFDYDNTYVKKKRILGFFKDIDSIKKEEENLKIKAELDPLTKLLNVKAGEKIVKDYLLSNEDSLFNAMIIIDIDNFKTINDTLGHQKGDKVLKIFSKTFTEIFRNSDIIYRLGGDEFIIFIKALENADNTLTKIMTRLFSTLKEKEVVESLDLKCSIGIFTTNKNYNYNYFYTQADKALYQVKKKTKNNYHIIIEK